MHYLKVFILSAFLFYISPALSMSRDTAPEPGKFAPPVELYDLSGKAVSLKDFKGKVVLLNFWATICAPCVAEMPSLNNLYESLKADGLVVIAVAIDSNDKPVREFVANKRIAFPVLLDREKEVFFDNYAGPSLPASFIIDRDGRIIEKYSGAKEWDAPEIKARMMRILKQK